MDLAPPRAPRSPWQRLYATLHQWRRAYWRSRAESLPRPVVSVGNVHWGGAGKTPLTAAIAAHLRDGGRRVCILSRGYGRRSDGVRLVSDGGPPLLGPSTAGDEPVLLAGELPGVAVVVAKERHQAGHHALERLDPPPEIFLLDDGFSHLRLTRDIDLLAFPAADPFGGGRLPPGGRLREPLAAVGRADAVLLTGLDAAEAGRDDLGNQLAAALRPHGFRGPGFACVLETAAPRTVAGRPLSPGTRVLLVCAIARPDRFAATARGLDLRIAGELAFPDHHDYPERSLVRIRRVFEESGATAVLTTSKDRVKLHRRLDLPLAELPVRAVPEAGFWSWLDRCLLEIAVAPGDGKS